MNGVQGCTSGHVQVCTIGRCIEIGESQMWFCRALQDTVLMLTLFPCHDMVRLALPGENSILFAHCHCSPDTVAARAAHTGMKDSA